MAGSPPETSLAPDSATQGTPLDKAELLAAFERLLQPNPHGINEIEAKHCRKSLDELGELDPTNETEQALIEKSEKLRARIHRQVEQRESDYQKALDLTKALEKAVKANQLAEAEATEKEIVKLVEHIPGLSDQRLGKLEKRLRRARPKLKKLESWRHWGTTQARSDLIDQMKQLEGSRLHPEKLAKTIQAARDQWREWDKSGDNAGKSLWVAFDKACEKAYEPCIAHFEKLKKQRSDNLHKASAHLDKLQAYYDGIDWKHPDWKAIDKHLRRERGAFFKIGHADFKHRKKLRTRLEEITGQFETHLGRERTRCVKMREKLISDAEALAEVADIRQALDQLEQLREKWTPTVLEKRPVENALWDKFQAACKVIYAKRDENRQAQFAERDENLKQKSALLEALTTLADEHPDTLLENTNKLAQLKSRWSEIGEVPRKAEKNLMQRWRAAQQAFSKALNAAQSQAANAEFGKLVDRATLCTQRELASGGDHTELETQWAALPPLADDTLADAIESRWQAAAKPIDDARRATNLTTKNLACLKLEVLFDLPSPDAFSGARMKFQIERLNASLKKDTSAQESSEALFQTLLTTGAVPAEESASLQTRTEALTSHQRSGAHRSQA